MNRDVESLYATPTMASDLVFGIVTKRLVTRRKTLGLDNPNQLKHIVRSMFLQVESFQLQGRISCMFQCEELFTFEELKRAGGILKVNTAWLARTVSENQFSYWKSRLIVDAIQEVVGILTLSHQLESSFVKKVCTVKVIVHYA